MKDIDMLKLYAGKDVKVTLVNAGDLVGPAKALAWMPTEGLYAIPGGAVCTEEQVRKWASQEGFTVKNCY